MDSTESIQVSEEVAIEDEAIFKAAMTKLGSNEYKIQFKTTNDHKHFAILHVQINDYPYAQSPKQTTIYSYFHDTLEDAQRDAYSEAVSWLQAEANLIIDSKAKKQLKEAQHNLRMSASMAAIMEEKYNAVAAEAAKLKHGKELAMTEMIATAKKMPTMLNLVDNTTPLKPTSTPYPHMIYMGEEPPRNEKEQLAESLSKVYTLLRLA